MPGRTAALGFTPKLVMGLEALKRVERSQQRHDLHTRTDKRHLPRIFTKKGDRGHATSQLVYMFATCAALVAQPRPQC